MLLQEPPPSQFDLHFSVFGFPVRIAWTFWLVALFLGYGAVMNVDDAFALESPGPLPLMLIWIAAVFTSILVHELGHTLAFRQCGIHSAVVLYHFGGLAVPIGGAGPWRAQTRLSSRGNLWIAAAGPLAQLALAALVVAATRLAGYEVWSLWILPGAAHLPEWLMAGEPIRDVSWYALVNFLVWPSVFWALLNLIPVWPLDGGRIAREVITLSGGTVQQATVLSLVAAGLVAFWGFSSGNLFLAILFVSLAIGSYQLLQSFGPWER